jgi:pimeloyl-ACP methyl ester carboxylesterase
MPEALRLYPKLFGNMEAEELDRFVEWSRIPGTNRSFQKTVSGSINFWGQYVRTIDRVGEVKVLPPTALFWGDGDRIIPFKQSKKAISISTGVTLTTYKGCGHFPHLEYPARFAADLTNFLLDPDRPNAVVRV